MLIKTTQNTISIHDNVITITKQLLVPNRPYKRQKTSTEPTGPTGDNTTKKAKEPESKTEILAQTNKKLISKVPEPKVLQKADNTLVDLERSDDNWDDKVDPPTEVDNRISMDYNKVLHNTASKNNNGVQTNQKSLTDIEQIEYLEVDMRQYSVINIVALRMVSG